MKIELITEWDLPDTKHIPDGYDFTEVPVASDKNIQVIMNKINEIIVLVNSQESK